MIKRILVTGATGYVGGRLVPRLLEAGYRVRCLVRDIERLQGFSWLNQVEVVKGDALDRESLSSAMRNTTAAYYLIHGMQGGKVYAERDLQMAHNFATAAEEAELKRIIYLGELVDPTANLSPYLRGRHETGGVLRRGRVQVTEFRAGMIIGSGSILFEMIRYLAERQPVFICPRWYFSRAQPIAIRDVLAYLIAALKTPESVGKIIEIGGATRLRYADMLLGYAHERGLKRLLIPTPFYAPRLSAYWVHMITPIHWRIVRPLIEGLHAESVVQDDLARQLFPHIQPLDYQTAVHLALGRIQSDTVETTWSDALVTVQGDITPVRLTTIEGMMVERRSRPMDLPPGPLFRAYTGLGGERGWLYLNWAWEVRGWMDKLVGGVGLRRGRRHPDEIRVGESLDFWRVEAIEPNRLIRLRAEMKAPGKAWLEFQSMPRPDGKTLLTQTASFAPRGLSGFLYWYLLYPIHAFIFSGLIRKVAERAQQLALKQIDIPTIEVNVDPNRPILVTGASGYIGGHLTSLLLARAHRVRCLVRNPEWLRCRAWFSRVEIANTDVLTREGLDQAMQGVSAAYYLIHSMTSGPRYHERDISAARNFAAAASAAGVEHIIYLGGLADPTAEIGRHLRSRLQTGDALRQGNVPVTEFRASPIIGPGSTAFEMIRYLTEQLPILVGPRWLYNHVQPVAIQNVLDYLLAALETPSCRGQIYEIGSQDVITYAEMMLAYARLRGLKRRLLVLPGLPLCLMAFLVDKLTPIPANIARPLIEGLRGDSVVRDHAARRVFPDIQPIGYPLAISTALKESPSVLVRSSKRDEINQPVRRREI